MVDSAEEEQGNVSLPPSLQSRSGDKAAPIINTQIAYYDILIKDGERNIERLENRNNELLDQQENTETEIANLDVETGDEIARLTKLILLESGKVDETQRKIDNLEKLREEEGRVHQKNVDSSDEKFEDTRMALTLAMKAMNAKINTLEDYKNTRSALLEKLKMQDDTLKRNEEETMQKEDAIDRKFKIDREKLKNEMFARLLDLTGRFQLENAEAIALPIHRLMRENIFIRAELSKCVDEILQREESCSKMQTMELAYRHSIRSDTSKKRKHLINSMIQRHLLRILKKTHLSMKQRLDPLPELSFHLQETYDCLYNSVKVEHAKCETRRVRLEILCHRKKMKLEHAKYLKSQADLRAKIYEETLYDVKYAVSCALKLVNTGQDIYEMCPSELISLLLRLFTKGESQIERCLASHSVESVLRPHNIYAKGDLGFEPEHIYLDSERIISEASLMKESSDGIIVASPATFDDARLSTTFAHEISATDESEESHTRSRTSTRSSDNVISSDKAQTEIEESRKSQDITDAIVSDENEDSLSTESENEDEA